MANFLVYSEGMKQIQSPPDAILVLERGEELIDSLVSYAREHNLSGAWLQSGLGGAGSAILSFYDLETKTYIDTTLQEPLEIISLQGNLSFVDGEPFWHIHGSFGTRSYQTLSGHVKALTIALTAELLIQPLNSSLVRSYDPATGLKLLKQNS